MTYNYSCQQCDNNWDEVQFMNDRDLPLTEPCPNCNMKGFIKRNIGSLAINTSGYLTLQQRNGTNFNDLLCKIKKGSSRQGCTIETR